MSPRPTYAFDTNAPIHALKGIGRVRERLAAANPGEIAVPAVAVYELEHGTLRAAKAEESRQELQRLLGVIEVLPFDRMAAERSALVRSRPERRGETLGPFDLMIAGTALAFGCRRVTHNRTEFGRVELKDWF